MAVIAYLGLPSPQAFISKARKARDAWTASFIYADLMREGLMHITNLGLGIRVIQPHFDPAHPPHALRACLPNYTAIRFAQLNEAKAALDSTAQAMSQHFVERASEVKRHLERLAGHIDDTMWDQQIQTFPEVLWCVVEGTPGEQEDELATRALHVWDARKLLRDRVQLAPRQTGASGCTMCGRREMVTLDRTAVKRLADRLPRDFRPSEGLCAVCLVVRFRFSTDSPEVSRGFGVPSVTTVAASPWLARAAQAMPEIENSDFADAAKNARWVDSRPTPVPGQKTDPALVHLVALLDAIYDVDPPEPSSKEPKARAQVDEDVELVRLYRPHLFDQTGRPPRRYALVAYDGDQVGEFFRACTSAQRDKASKQLATFAMRTAPELLESADALGVLLYAGGDDGRFLVPVDRTLRVVNQLRAAFSGLSDGDEIDRYPLAGVTLSAGIAVADAHHPLELVVEEANRALETAKSEEYGRNAFCVAWLTGGGVRAAGGKFTDGLTDLVDELQVVTRHFADRSLSRSLASTFEALARHFDANVPEPVFADLARERLLMAPHTAAGDVIERWLGSFPPRRAAGLVRLSRDLAAVEG